MPTLDATGLSIALVSLAASSAAAQSTFRPLPHLPSLDALWIPASEPAARAEPEGGDPAARETFADLRLFASSSLAGDLEGGGSVATQQGGWAATLGKRFDGERIAALELSTEALFYDFSGNTTLVPGSTDPFNDMYRARLAGQLRTQIDSRLSYFTGVELGLGSEDDASTGDSLYVGAAGGVRVDSGERLSMWVGLAALSQLEDDPWIWPWLGFEWQASERLELAANGTEVEARVELGSSWSATARVEYLLRQFRLNDDNALAGGALRDEDIRASLGLHCELDSGVAFGLVGGASLWRELNLFDSGGDHAGEQEVDAAPFVALSLSLSL